MTPEEIRQYASVDENTSEHQVVCTLVGLLGEIAAQLALLNAGTVDDEL